MAIAFRNLDPEDFLEDLVAVNPASIAAGAVGTVDVTVAGLTTSHYVLAQPQASLGAGLSLAGLSIPSANTLRVHLYNPTAGAVDGGSVNWAVFAWLPRP